MLEYYLRNNQNINVNEIIVAMAIHIAKILICEKDLIGWLEIDAGIYSIFGFYEASYFI